MLLNTTFSKEDPALIFKNIHLLTEYTAKSCW